jgi:DNA-binding MarR family transcriptional regulator
LRRSWRTSSFSALHGLTVSTNSTGNLPFVADGRPDHRLHPAPRLEGGPFLGRPLRDVWAHFVDELLTGIAARHPDVTATMNDVMLLIDPAGTRVADLARRAGVAKQSMAQAVAGLETRGFVRRQADPDDGRAKLVVLTDAGWEALRFGRSVVDGIQRRWTGLIGAEAMAELIDRLGALATALDAAAADHG